MGELVNPDQANYYAASMGSSQLGRGQPRGPWEDFFHHLRLWIVAGATIAVPFILWDTRGQLIGELKALSENAANTATVLREAGEVLKETGDHPPVFVGPREGVVKVLVGDEHTVNFEKYFVDDGSYTLYVFSTTPRRIAVKSIEGTEVTLIGIGVGQAQLQLTAIDERGGSADSLIVVTVEPS